MELPSSFDFAYPDAHLGPDNAEDLAIDLSRLSKDSAPMLKSIEVYQGHNSNGASTLVHLLWLCKPELAREILNLRVQSLQEVIASKAIANNVAALRKTLIAFQPVTAPNCHAMIPLQRLFIRESTFESDQVDHVAALVCGHATLTLLSLRGFTLSSQKIGVMQRLAHAISLSNLRTLDLSNNHLSPRALLDFLDNLSLPCLLQLDLSTSAGPQDLAKDQDEDPLWQQGDQSWKDGSSTTNEVWNFESDRIKDCLIHLISGARGAPYVPRLESLCLRRYHFSWDQFKAIIQTVLRSNGNLESLELDYSIVDAEGKSHLASSRAPWVMDYLSTYDPSARYSAEVSDTNWHYLLRLACRQNAENKEAVMESSRRFLPIARTLTYKSGRSSTAVESHIAYDWKTNTPMSEFLAPFRFCDLPQEIRKEITVQAGLSLNLSYRQVENILGFAGEGTTLGYGSERSNRGLTASAMAAVKQEMLDHSTSPISASGVVLHKAFRWKDIFQKYSVPRDWLDDIQDLLAEGKSFKTSSRDLLFAGEGCLLPEGDREIWLKQQPGLQAYWEATGTYCADFSV